MIIELVFSKYGSHGSIITQNEESKMVYKIHYFLWKNSKIDNIKIVKLEV